MDALDGLGCVGIVGTFHLGTLASFDVNDLLIRGRSIRSICEGDGVPQKFIPDLVNLYL
ncbi:hypothetical protein D3C76_1394920 [compost metagenome]